MSEPGANRSTRSALKFENDDTSLSAPFHDDDPTSIQFCARPPDVHTIMSESAHLEVLSNVDIFANLEKKDLTALAAIAKVEKQKAGRIIFRPGDPSDSFRVAVSGAFDCYLWDELFKIERPITVFKRGDIFGEMVALSQALGFKVRVLSGR